MRPCRYDPKLSAYEALEGNFSCDHTPLAPLGSKAIAHDTPQQRATWVPHGHCGWLAGPAMDHCRCFTIFNPKTRGTSIVNTFHWSESNRFSVPRITPEEQIVTAAKNLATAIKSGPLLNIPSPTLQTDIDKLCKIFQETADRISTTKLAPTSKESSETLNQFATPEEGTTHPRVIEDDSRPRVRIVKSSEKSKPEPAPNPTNSLPTETKKPISSISKSMPKVIAPTYVHKPLPVKNHRYLTRAIVAAAANTTQLEQRQTQSPAPVTHQLLTDIANPPNVLRYKHLIRTNDRSIWEQSMCNELGWLSQGYKSIKGRNTIFFID